MQGANPYKLVLQHTKLFQNREFAFIKERFLLNLFKKYRAFGGSEWFKLDKINYKLCCSVFLDSFNVKKKSANENKKSVFNIKKGCEFNVIGLKMQEYYNQKNGDLEHYPVMTNKMKKYII